MLTTIEFLRWISAISFALIGAAAWREWRRGGSTSQGRLAFAIGLLGFVSIMGRFNAALPERNAILSGIGLILFTASGYALLYFRHALIPMRARTLRGAAVLGVIASVAGIAVRFPPAGPSAYTPVHFLVLWLIVLVWSVFVFEPALRFWRAARLLPLVQRARTRALSGAYLAIVVLLLTAVATNSGAQPNAKALIMQFAGLSLVPLLLASVSPPRFLRAMWRGRERRHLRSTLADMLSTRHGEAELQAGALEWGMRLIGGGGAVLTDDEGLLGFMGLEEEHARALSARARELAREGAVRPAAVSVPLARGTLTLAVVEGQFSPVFGRDDLDLLREFVAALAPAFDRVRLIDELSVERDRTQAFVDSIGKMGEAFLVIDPDGRPETCNSTLTGILGYTLEDLQRLPSVFDIAAPEAREESTARFARRIRGDEPDGHFEVAAIHKDGRRVMLEVGARRVDFGHGPRVLAILRDVTERAAAQEREGRRLSQLAAFAGATRRIAASRDPDTLNASVAEAAVRILRAKGAAFVVFDDGVLESFAGAGLRRDEIEADGLLPDAGGTLAETLAAGRSVRIDSLPRDARGAGRALMAVPVMRQGSLRALLYVVGSDGAFDDIDDGVATTLAVYAAEVLEVARALQREHGLVARLKELDEVKNAFLSAVSHELRTPLTSVLGFATTLWQEGERIDARDREEMSKRLVVNARKLERLLADLLDLDRLSRGIIHPVLRPTDLADLVLGVVDGFDASEHTLGAAVVPVTIDVDPAKVERIIENLLANAVRHTVAGSRIWVRTEAFDGGALISVEDNGPGVPEHLRERIFEPFRQGSVERHAPGVGIGLSLVARFAELHGGRAWVEERDGGGASFRVFLPGPSFGPAPEPARLRVSA